HHVSLHSFPTRRSSDLLNADVESMWTSSMTYTLNRPRLGAYAEFSRSWRISSTLVLVAASTSIRSTKRPASISTQAEHFPQGLEDRKSTRLNSSHDQIS